MSSVQVHSLSVSYAGASPVLEEVSMVLPAGQVTAILGPNGSGKTTLLHALLGLIPYQSGSVEILGRSLESYSRRDLGRAVGLVPQEEQVVFEFTVLEYVLFGRAPYLGALQAPGQEDVDLAGQALVQVGAQHLAERLLPSLSGGERQLVVIARVLAQDPKVLLLDEPTAHLDLAKHGPLRSLLRHLAKDGRSVTFTSHDPNFAASVADRLILLRQGRVLAEGSLAETFQPGPLEETYGVSLQVVTESGHLLLLEP